MNAAPPTPQSGTAGSKLFTLLSAEDIQSLPEPDWLIDGVLPSAGLASVYGSSGVGKTFVCLDLVAAVATGRLWFGYPTKPSRVVYIALEGQAGLPRRVRAWAKHNGQPYPEGVQFIFDPFAVTNPKHLAGLASTIDECGGAGLIVIDTLNRAAPGADENTSSDMGKILAGAAVIQKKTGGMVLLVHHPGKDSSRGLRGHSSLHAALDTVIEVDRHGELIRWTSVKVKDDVDGVSHLFNLIPVELEPSRTGRMLTSCVVTPVEGSISLRKVSEPEGKHQKEILPAVRAILVEQRIQSALSDPDWPNGFPEGLPYDFILERIKDTLIGTSTKHRLQRTKEALASLIDGGFLRLNGDLICLPSKVAPTNVEGKNVI